MSTQQYKPSLDAEEFERQVVKFLREHPEFFVQHPELLAELNLPHRTGGPVSLIEKQVAVLREQKETIRKKLQTLIHNAQTNEQLNERLNNLTLALLDSHSLDALVDLVLARLTKDFNADAVVIRLFNTGHPTLVARPELVDWSEPFLGAFEKVIRERRPVCGRLAPGQLESLFNDEAGLIMSAALLPLIENENSRSCLGMLAIGSRDRERFRADMGTLFLSQLSKVLTRVLKKYLRP
ncbi:MAG: DUF484 family protein [Gammaproteobacteria bacterium]|nr:DUF484 family protein [Gammaproteobacteria bacterium]